MNICICVTKAFVDYQYITHHPHYTEGTDFTEAETQVTIPARSREGCVEYTIVDDTMSEGNEVFNAVITEVTGGRSKIGYPNTTAVTIIDGLSICLAVSLLVN